MTLTRDGRIARIAETLPLAPVVVVPRERTSTEASRSALPASVPHADAAASAGYAALLAAGAAAGDADLFAAGLDDRLHEPYRPSAVLDAVRDEPPAGARGATLSGLGPDRDRLGRRRRGVRGGARRGASREHDVHVLAVAPRGAL